MICLLLIMMMIFVNGLEITEEKVKQSKSVLKEEEMNAKTKAWLLMVESGKVDEEELRRITPKSIFIAPLLTGRAEKCKEGYRHDHLGQCVKVIKIDPKVQLELLLKRLNMMYNEKKEEKEGLLEVSNGPLHFSIPISNENEKKVRNISENIKTEMQSANASASEIQSFPELIPIPLPIVLLNQTKEVESSGMGPLNDSELYVPQHFEGSGFASGDIPSSEHETTSSISLISEGMDYLDVTETEPKGETQSSTEIPIEFSTLTPSPLDDTNLTESYQNITVLSSVNDSIIDMLNGNVQNVKIITNNSKSDIIYFPSDKEVKSQANPLVDSGFIHFPDSLPFEQPDLNYHSSPPSINQNSQYQMHQGAISRQQFWWLPENWKVEENQPKSTLVKFWSRLPLTHDIGYSEENKDGFKKHFPLSQPNFQIYDSPPKNRESAINFENHQSSSNKRTESFRSGRFQEVLSTPRHTF